MSVCFNLSLSTSAVPHFFLTVLSVLLKRHVGLAAAAAPLQLKRAFPSNEQLAENCFSVLALFLIENDVLI